MAVVLVAGLVLWLAMLALVLALCRAAAAGDMAVIAAMAPRPREAQRRPRRR